MKRADLQTTPNPAELLAWYDRHARKLPWRAVGVRPDPYHIWLSEIMLQQTTVAAVQPYFLKFLKRWPTVSALADAALDDVLTQWAGLGYYARARNLHKCAKTIKSDHAGQFPQTEPELLKLPGIGPYTAAAITAIAHDTRAVVVDGNVERVMARVFGVKTPLPAAKPALRDYADGLTPEARPGDYAQAVMDLGATICTPRKPNCEACPWQSACIAQRDTLTEILPRRSPKPQKPHRKAIVYWAQSDDGFVLCRARPPTGLLGGMMEIPSSPWREEMPGRADIARHAPFKADWGQSVGTVRHTFTHFHLEFDLYETRFDKRNDLITASDAAPWQWLPIARLNDYAFPSLMKKVIALAVTPRSVPKI